MNKTKKRGLQVFALVVCIMVAILGIDLYMDINGKPKIDEHTIVMARIDFKQDIGTADAEKITGWLYAQQGINHVLCNADGNCVVFTYYPIKADADNITTRMQSDLSYEGRRYVPSEADMAKGCPVSPNSLTFKVYSFFKNII